METSQPAAAKKQRSFARHYGFIGIITCFVLGILISTVYTLHRLHKDAIETHFTIGDMYARSFEDHLTQSFNFIDKNLSTKINEIIRGKTSEQLEDSFRDLLQDIPYLRSLSLVDAHGTIVASSNSFNNGHNALTDSFKLTKETTGFLQIGKPWSGRDFADANEITDSSPVTSETLGFFSALRAFEINGSLYALVAAVNPDYFINFYNQSLGHEYDHVEILRYDGTPLLFTGEKKQLGDNSRNESFVSGLGEREFGRLEQLENRDLPRLVSYRASRIFPLVVVTRIDRNQALEQWKKERQRLLVVVTPSLFLVVIASILLYRRQRRIQVEQIEADRREHEKFATTVFDTVAEAVLATDTETKIVLVNPALRRVTGYTPEELLGKTPSIFSTGIHPPAFYRQMWENLKQTGYWEGELFNRRKDGRLWIAWTSISRVCDSKGHVTNYVAGYSDITDRKQMEESLRSAKELAESANKAKSEFLAAMSHEIRTPMNGVIGMTGLLLDTTLDEEQQKYARIVRNCGENLLELINDILDFSKIEANRLSLEEMPFDLCATVEETLEILAPKAVEKELEISTMCDPAVPVEVMGDPGRLRQILMNLVGNAIKFTKKGAVSVGVELIASAPEELLIIFRIKDTGIGIPSDRIEAIFEPFTQADGSTTRKFGGTGLGLAICKQLCKLMGGDIGVESEAGQGSTFWFTVRFKPMPESAQQAERPTPAKELKCHSTDDNELRQNSAKILLADDNHVNQVVALAVLKKLGYRADVVANGLEALEALSRIPYDLVLMDCQMPEMDGFEATIAIRNGEKNVLDRFVPIIAMTANAMQGDREKCTNTGMNDYISKPVKPDTLRQILEKWLKPKVINEQEVAYSLEKTRPDCSPSGEIINIGKIHELVEETSIMKEIVAIGMESIPQRVEQLVEAVKTGDLKMAIHLAHSIKGMTACLWAERLNNTITLVENALEKENLGEAAELMPQTREQAKLLVLALEKWNTSNSPSNDTD